MKTQKLEYKGDAKNLYCTLVKLEYAISTVIWEDVLEHFNKTSKKLQTLGFDIFESYLLPSSLLSFFKELWEIRLTGLHTINQKQKVCVRISPQVILMIPNALLQRNFPVEQVVVLL